MEPFRGRPVSHSVPLSTMPGSVSCSGPPSAMADSVIDSISRNRMSDAPDPANRTAGAA